MDWPAHIPDLSPIDNVGGVLARGVCHDLSPFGTLEELTDCILEEWTKLELQLAYNLICTVTKRCSDVPEPKGFKIGY